MKLSISHIAYSACWDTPPGKTLPWADTSPGRHPPRWSLLRTVRILLDCFLVILRRVYSRPRSFLTHVPILMQMGTAPNCYCIGTEKVKFSSIFIVTFHWYCQGIAYLNQCQCHEGQGQRAISLICVSLLYNTPS